MSDIIKLPVEQICNWGVMIFKKCGLNDDEAKCLMDVLVQASLRGVDTHGVYLITRYSNVILELKRGKMKVVSETPATCVIDGNDELGQIVSVFAMGKAIEKAQQNGSGISVARNSNHFGPCCHYSIMATQKDLIGISMTAGTKCMPPWGGMEPFVGNNPFSVALPGIEFPIVLDMATSAVAVNKIMIYKREGKPLPDGWAFDKDGNPTNDAAKAAESMLMAPIGGYKGVGISIIVVLLCGVLSQGQFSDTIPQMHQFGQPRKISHFFAAFRITDFLPMNTYREIIKAYSHRFHNIRKRPGVEQLYMPGELEWVTSQKRSAEGIPCEEGMIKEFNTIADKVGAKHIL
jgi:LDH2 family malate/lactate/ureidoglycolate dehydrogenase